MVPAYSPGIWDEGTEGSGGQVHVQIHSEFEASLCNMILSLHTQFLHQLRFSVSFSYLMVLFCLVFLYKCLEYRKILFKIKLNNYILMSIQEIISERENMDIVSTSKGYKYSPNTCFLYFPLITNFRSANLVKM